MNKSKPQNEHLQNRFISAGKECEVSLATTSLILKLDNVIVPIDNILDSYISILEENSLEWNLTDAEYKKYKYKPKYMSLDLYKTTELAFLILKLNKLESEMDFTIRKVKIFNPNKLDMINKIIINEEEKIKQNRISNGV